MRLLLPLPFLLASAAAAQFVPPTRDPSPRVGPFVAAAPQAPDSWRETRDIRHRIRKGRDSGQLSRREARDLGRESGVIDAAAARYAADGLSASEQRELAIRAQVLRDEVIARRSGVAVAPAARVGQRGR